MHTYLIVVPPVYCLGLEEAISGLNEPAAGAQGSVRSSGQARARKC